MTNPTDHWASFQKWEDDEKHTQRIKNVLNTANFTFIRSTALSIRVKSEQKPEVRKRKRARASKPLMCTVDTTKLTGDMQNLVIELKFPDGVSWICRFRFLHEGDDDEQVEESMLAKSPP